MYEEGLGVKRSDVEAMKWYQLAAERGHAPAQAKVGVSYRFGRGTDQNFAEAMRWSKLAAEQGDAAGQVTLGYMYQHGEGVDRDNVEAMKWLQLAAEQSNSDAMNAIGWIYEHGGDGVDQDYAKAMAWYELGAEQSNSYALNNLGRMYHGGMGVDYNYTMAKTYYERAAAVGSSHATTNLEKLERYQTKQARDQFVKSELGDQRSISHSICSTWENVMLNQTVYFRQVGIPVSTAVETYNSESDVPTRVFLKQFARSIYEDPAEGKEMIENGIFFVMCVQEHRGF
jgi:TPR repeat protein